MARRPNGNYKAYIFINLGFLEKEMMFLRRTLENRYYISQMMQSFAIVIEKIQSFSLEGKWPFTSWLKPQLLDILTKCRLWLLKMKSQCKKKKIPVSAQFNFEGRLTAATIFRSVYSIGT